jgi:hypothetical protein
LAAHLEEFDGTIVRRGAPVENHCSRHMLGIQILQKGFHFRLEFFFAKIFQTSSNEDKSMLRNAKFFIAVWNFL